MSVRLVYSTGITRLSFRSRFKHLCHGNNGKGKKNASRFQEVVPSIPTHRTFAFLWRNSPPHMQTDNKEAKKTCTNRSASTSNSPSSSPGTSFVWENCTCYSELLVQVLLACGFGKQIPDFFPLSLCFFHSKVDLFKRSGGIMPAMQTDLESELLLRMGTRW